VFDESLDPASVGRLNLLGPVVLFPLTGDWIRIQAMQMHCTDAGLTPRLLESGRRVDDEVLALRHELPEWADRIAATRVQGRSVVEWLSIPQAATSAFWFGSIAERNPMKTREFLHVAQARALAREAEAGGYALCVVAVGSGALAKAFAGVFRAQRLNVRIVAKARGADAGSGLRGVAAQSGWVATLFVPVAVLARFAFRAWQARGVRSRAPQTGRERPTHLIVTYYPYVERDAGIAGTFRNKFFGPLQTHLESGGRRVRWAGLFVHIDGWSFRDAIALTRGFQRGGADVTMLDAYLSPARAIRIAWRWARLARRAARLEASVSPVLDAIVPTGAATLARRLWRRSFVGVDVVRGLYYLEVFDALVADAEGAGTCLYFVEYQAWEQALNAVARQRAPQMHRIGFQHTSVSRNHYFYFRTRDEIARSNSITDMPLPDILAANGQIPAALLRESGFDDVREVEAIRQLHLADVIGGETARAGGHEVLVAGSIDADETRALISMVVAAWPAGAPFIIRLKPHPSMPLAGLLADLKLDAGAVPFEPAAESIAEALARAAVVVVASSAVAVEALAYGCEVIVPTFPSFPCLTPLSGFEEHCRRVYAPDQLRDEVADVIARGPRRSASDKRAFARRYWRLDATLPRWDALLFGAEVTSVSA
jgi:surface carbohydrate biosynthesis protein (TIGR04326 family)